jgi:hypothetical protein
MTGDGRSRPVRRIQGAIRPRMTRIDPKES